MTTLGAGLEAGRDAFRETDGRDGLPERAGRRDVRFRFLDGLRLEVVRAFTARRNFAMPGW